VHPLIAAGEAFLAAEGARRHGADAVEMAANGAHVEERAFGVGRIAPRGEIDGVC
jgi:hypothetical protein